MSEWFALLGQPVEPAERALVDEYLRGLGIVDDLPVVGVRDWSQARDVASDTMWDHRWWEAEQLEKRRIYSCAFYAVSQRETLRLLSSTLDVDGAVKAAASLAAARFGCSDAGLIGSAAGAASEATYLGELARLTGEGSRHPFRLKETLFERGRWPLGILGGRFWLF